MRCQQGSSSLTMTNRRWLATCVVATLLFAIAYTLATVFPVGNLTGGTADYFVTLFASFLLLFWGITMSYRVQFSRQRTILTLIFIVSFLWILLRFVKWLPNDIPIAKYSDYVYYLPMTLVPALFLVLCIENFAPNFRFKKALYISLALVVLFFFVMALTTDLHGLVYKNYSFGLDENGIPSARFPSYSYGIVHYFDMGFVALCILSSLFVATFVSRGQLTIKSVILPAIIVVLAAAYFTLYSLGISFVRSTLFLKDFALMSVLLLQAAIEIMLDTGLVQNNGRYVTHFERSSLPMCIYDENGKMLFSSEKFDEKRFKTHDAKFRYNEQTIGKYELVVEEDLTEIIALKDKINQENNELTETNKLLHKMIDVARDSTSLAFRLSLISEIEGSIGKSRAELDEMLSTLPDEITKENQKETKETLGRIALCLGYMKQKCMLLLGAKEKKALSADAFKMLLNVISHDVQSVGFAEVGAAINCEDDVSFPFALAVNELANEIAKAYAFLELDALIIINPKKSSCIFELEGKPLSVKPLTVAGATIKSKVQDNGLRVVMEVQNA